MALRFFGLTSEHRESEWLEHFFLLMYYGGFTWKEFLHMPIKYRYWLIGRINKEMKAAADAGNEIPSKSPHHNTAQARALTNKTRDQVPARLRRFT